MPPNIQRRVIVYIDGLNLYGTALVNTTWKWLDLKSLSESLKPAGSTLEAVKYFSSELSPVAAEDPDSPKRQRNYMKALQASGVEVHRGTFFVGRVWRTFDTTVPWEDRLRPEPDPTLASALATAEAATTRPWKAKVELPVEKFTDVALGVELVDDFHNERCDIAILLSNDRDLRPAVEKVVQQGHTVGVFTPGGDTNKHLRKAASWVRPIRANLFGKHQFPMVIRCKSGRQFECPNVWKP